MICLIFFLEITLFVSANLGLYTRYSISLCPTLFLFSFSSGFCLLCPILFLVPLTSVCCLLCSRFDDFYSTDNTLSCSITPPRPMSPIPVSHPPNIHASTDLTPPQTLPAGEMPTARVPSALRICHPRQITPLCPYRWSLLPRTGLLQVG